MGELHLLKNGFRTEFQMPSKSNLTSSQRKAIFIFLHKHYNGKKKLPNGLIQQAMEKFQCSDKSVRRIWQLAKTHSIEETEAILRTLSPKKKKRCGRKRKIVDEEQIKRIPLSKRKTIRSLAFQLNVSPSLIYRIKLRGIVGRHRSTIKPLLSQKNMMDRLRFVLSKLRYSDGQDNFDPFFQSIHIDEKWFYLTKKNDRYYLVAGEHPPHRSIQSKNFIPKIMFLAAVARPHQKMYGGKPFLAYFVCGTYSDSVTYFETEGVHCVILLRHDFFFLK
jgi:hypothetical protein